jgi:hypothetical protein
VSAHLVNTLQCHAKCACVSTCYLVRLLSTGEITNAGETIDASIACVSIYRRQVSIGSEGAPEINVSARNLAHPCSAAIADTKRPSNSMRKHCGGNVKRVLAGYKVKNRGTHNRGNDSHIPQASWACNTWQSLLLTRKRVWRCAALSRVETADVCAYPG